MNRTRILLIAILSLAGCQDAVENSTDKITYHRDIAPLVMEHCAGCHRPGEAAPFSLLTYDDALARAVQIVEVTSTRFMPPWLPEAGHEKFVGERRLSDTEIQLLARWVDAGSPEGVMEDASPAPKFTDGWQLGEPDLILDSPEFAVSAAGNDRFRNFVLTAPEGESHWVRAVELRPLNPSVTHHARLGIDNTGESVRRDAADEEVGYEGMAWGEDPAGQLITWTPGMQPDAGNPATAWKFEPDAKLVLHTHVQPSGKPETVSFRVGFYFADKPPTVHPTILRIGSRDIDIPAGVADFAIRDTYELPIDVDATFIFPHAHSLCREIHVQAELPEGSARTLIAINDFDENWHDKYRFAKSIRLTKGTRLFTEFIYDNTSANIRNPHNPPLRVVYGSNAKDEMADVYLQVIPVDSKQLAILKEHHGAYELASKIVGYRKTLSKHSDDPWAREALASCYVANHEPDLAVALLEKQPQLVENSNQARVILGMAHLAGQDIGSAEAHFRKAIEIDEKLPLAWLGLAQARVASDQRKPAEEAFQHALNLAPLLIVARLDLIDLLVAEERFDEAETQCKTAIDLDPSAHQPHLKLANIYAIRQQYDQSLAEFAAARKLAPFLYSPSVSLAIACYQAGDEKKAGELLQEAVQKDPSDPVPYFFLGQIARRNNDWPAARQYLQKSLELPLPTTWPPSHTKQFLTLVYTEQLQLAGQTEDASLLRTAAQAWLQMDPNNVALKNLLRDLKHE